ncbi:EAL domain-containing protein [Paenibacillus sp. SYP-B3998]|uniref:EAL domain-containing protein n=1 Tax=Paenibacillus sp. SYP-B3998 TaxID=2678564 RepID=A0A6G3ZY10_9BACL|nr:EAL domain-containing protein [Paenibacillus sp. SYP-B3998]NEW06938.1 EAL domain-containing protein [Paenibacillus sp. SYP-B3998]
MMTMTVIILLYFIPVSVLFILGIEVYRKNPYHQLNQIAAIVLFLMAVQFVGTYLVRYAALFYERGMVVWLFYFPSFLLMGVMLHFVMRLTGRFRTLPKWQLLAICYGPIFIFLGSLLFCPFPWLSVKFVNDGFWKYESASVGLRYIMLGARVYTMVTCIMLAVAGFRYVKKYDLNTKRKQIRVILLGVLLSSLWSVAFLFEKRPFFLPESFNYPDLGMFSLLWFALFLRFAVLKYDFLPSIDRTYQLLYDLSPLSILIINQEGMIKDINPQAAQLFEQSPQELLLRHVGQVLLIYESDIESLDDDYGEEPYPILQGNYTLETSSGARKHVRVESKDMKVQGELLQYVALIEVAKGKIAEERVCYLAYHDRLTGLPNKVFFENQLEMHLAKPNPDPFAIMRLEVYGFEHLNEKVGSLIGDLVLQHVAEQLRKYSPLQAVISRLSENTFALMVPEMVDRMQISILGSRVIEGLKEPFLYERRSLQATVSMGIALMPEHGQRAEQLMQVTDIALNQAKQQGENQVIIYEASVRCEDERQFQMNYGVRKGLEKGEFVLHYQPLIHMRSGEIIGVEALIRWVRPGIGFLSPDQFIVQAEETDSIVDIGYWVLNTVCEQLQGWIMEGLPPLMMSVNCSARQLLDLNFPKQLAETIQRTNLNPSLLCLEITENTAMMENENVLKACEEIMRLGVKLSIDDLGSRYASLMLLKRLSIHSIKIDRSFVKNIVQDEQDQTLIQGIISLSRELGNQVIAKGVEKFEQWELLSTLGCDEVQGYFLSRPLEAQELLRFMKQKGVTA